MDAVRAPDAQRVRVLARALGELPRELPRRRQDHLARALELQRQAGVDDVGGRQPIVDPAPGGPRGRRQHVDERRRVVVGDLLALVDGVDGERGRADRVEVVRRGALERLRGGHLDVAHRAEARLVGPYRADFRPGVAGDHGARS